MNDTELLEAAYIKALLKGDDPHTDLACACAEYERAFAGFGVKRPTEQLQLPPPWELHIDQRVSQANRDEHDALQGVLARWQAAAEDLPMYPHSEPAVHKTLSLRALAMEGGQVLLAGLLAVILVVGFAGVLLALLPWN